MATELTDVGKHEKARDDVSGALPFPASRQVRRIERVFDAARALCPPLMVGDDEIEPRAAIGPFIGQMKQASDAGLYLVALITALTLPDMLAALSSVNGRATGEKYLTWLQTHLGQSAEDAAQLYGFRCSLLHQGSPYPHGGFHRIAFVEPGSGQLHNLSTQVGEDRVGWLSVPMFVDDMQRGAEDWLSKHGGSHNVRRNLTRFARRRPEGLPPHVVGAAVTA